MHTSSLIDNASDEAIISPILAEDKPRIIFITYRIPGPPSYPSNEYI
ncbi:MAG: hypothetical protein FGF53_02035 [Candidatus Brockarchaeota archaeon]|nr:hypothetical protein [Candidatus Brockarchaeota archaeon]MBO3809548.1 hypothetical protein [Candidatus Brockarchaeota archaeon]